VHEYDLERGTDEGPPLALTVSQVAKALQIGERSAYEAIRCGDIPSLRIRGSIRVPRMALDRLLGSTAGVNDTAR